MFRKTGFAKTVATSSERFSWAALVTWDHGGRKRDPTDGQAGDGNGRGAMNIEDMDEIQLVGVTEYGFGIAVGTVPTEFRPAFKDAQNALHLLIDKMKTDSLPSED